MSEALPPARPGVRGWGVPGWGGPRGVGGYRGAPGHTGVPGGDGTWTRGRLR